MIENINDALKFYAEREAKFSSFGAAVLKRRDRFLDDLDDVVNLLGLPESYARCAREIRMEGVALGYFDLCPGDTQDLCRSLLRLNGDGRNPVLPVNLLSVAAFDADIVAVTKGSPHHATGTVYFVDVTTSSKPQISAIADNFVDFLVLAGALDQAVLEDYDEPETMVGALALRLGCEGYAEKWKLIARMAV